MPVKFNNFTNPSTGISPSDFLVGYTNTNSGGERRWTLNQIANAIRENNLVGAVVQTRQIVKSDVSTRAGTAQETWQDIPGLALSITARSTNPDVRIQAMLNHSTNNSSHAAQFRIVRVFNNVETPVGVGVGERSGQTDSTASGNVYGGPAYTPTNTYIDFIDTRSPVNAGQSVRYKLQWYVWAAGVTAYMNRAYASTSNYPYDTRTISTLTLTELIGN